MEKSIYKLYKESVIVGLKVNVGNTDIKFNKTTLAKDVKIDVQY